MWMVYPERKEIHVLDTSGADRILGLGDALDAPDLLPGFSVAWANFSNSAARTLFVRR